MNTITYKSVFDSLNDTICHVLDEYGIKYERKSVLNEKMQMHETVLTITYKNDTQKRGISHLLTAVNMLAI